MRYKERMLILLLGIVMIIFGCSALAIGRYYVPVGQVIRILLSKVLPMEVSWTKEMWNVVMIIRMPRVMAAILTGASLALSGAVYQSVFKNPLVSPDLLGVSAGAGVGASLAILMHLPPASIQLMAFTIGILAVLLSIMIPKLLYNQNTLMLILAGIVVSGFMNAVQGFLKYIADSDSELPSIVYWLMGSLSAVKWSSIQTVAPVMILAGIVLLLLRWRINLLSLNDVEARSLGINVKKMRGLTIVCATILTASAVCLSGNVGWIGLIIPHLARLLAGEDNQNLLPVSVLLGASFMILTDTLARTITSAEIPLSIFSGMIGAPLFVLILMRKRGGVG